MSEPAAQPAPADGIKAIEHSIRCFSFSMASLIPLIGLPLVFIAFSDYRRARAAVKGRWNPAEGYLVWGSILGSLGLLISLASILFLICASLKLLPWQYHESA